MRFDFIQLVGSRYFRLGLGAVLAGLSIYLALRNVSLHEVQAAFARADHGLVGWALVSVLVNTVAKVYRWRTLLGPVGKALSFSKLSMSLLAGQALNTVYPARVGDLSRAYVVGGMGPGRVFVLGSILLEKLFDTISYFALFVVLLLLIPLPDWVNQSVTAFVGFASFGLVLVLLLIFRLDRFAAWIDKLTDRMPDKFQVRVQAWARSGLESLSILRNRRDILEVFGWSFLVWGTAVTTNHLALLALQIQLPITASILVLIVLQISVSLPSVPGRIGIFEYLCILSLAVFGVSQANGLSYGFLLHTVVLVPSTLIGLLFLGILGWSGEPSNTIQS